MPNDYDYEIVKVFISQFRGRCLLNYDHIIRKGKRVAQVRRVDNPFIPVPGVVCWSCARMLPRV